MDRLNYLRFCFLLFNLLVASVGQAQDKSNIDKKIQADALIEDFEILQDHLEKYHRGLYQYTSKEKLDLVFDRYKNKIKEPMSGIEFYRLIAPILAPIGNGHTDIDVPKDYFYESQNNLLRLPFTFYYDQEKLFITRNNSKDLSIEQKTVVTHINGKSVKELIELFKIYVTRDGYNQTLPLRSATGRFSLNYAYVIGTPDEFEMKMITPAGEKITKTVEALTLPEIRKNHKERYKSASKSFWSDASVPAIEYSIEGNMAVLKIRTFESKFAKKRGQPFKSFLKTAFADFNRSNVEHLILDLRENGGGDPMPTVHLMAHLYDKPFTFYKEVSANVNKFKGKQYFEYPMWLLNLQAKLKLRKKGDYYVVKNMDGTKEAKPKAEVFGGALYVLTSENSFSATGEMTAIIKELREATFIGVEPGGNPNQNTSGIMLPMVLPNSKLRVVLPIILWEMNVTFENTGYGVRPDHVVRKTVDEALAGKDVVLEYTKELIKHAN